jgi:hypothetical protein
MLKVLRKIRVVSASSNPKSIGQSDAPLVSAGGMELLVVFTKGATLPTSATPNHG